MIRGSTSCTDSTAGAFLVLWGTPWDAPSWYIRNSLTCEVLQLRGDARGRMGSWCQPEGGTYQDAWDDAERRTYQLNTARDRDKDGHACE